VIRPGPRLTILIGVLLTVLLAARTPASAQGENDWSFVLTPQLWASHVAKNGFAAPRGLGGIAIESAAYPEQTLYNQFLVKDSSPVDSINPQWGLQLAAQRGPWTFGASFQYVTFETRNEVLWNGAARDQLCTRGSALNPHTNCVSFGERVAQEFVNTTRLDMDFAATYFLPDLVAHRVDLSIGAGMKLIYATASREYGNLHAVAADIAALFPQLGTGLYKVCDQDDCSDQRFRDRVKTTSWLYGVTVPIRPTVRLTEDGRWLLALSVAPFIGAESRDDRGVVYRVDQNAYSTATVADDFRVRRLDGTTLAYGATADVTIRLALSDALSAYAGARVQYIKGHETYLAYGPLFGMSVRFGGK